MRRHHVQPLKARRSTKLVKHFPTAKLSTCSELINPIEARSRAFAHSTMGCWHSTNKGAAQVPKERRPPSAIGPDLPRSMMIDDTREFNCSVKKSQLSAAVGEIEQHKISRTLAKGLGAQPSLSRTLAITLGTCQDLRLWWGSLPNAYSSECILRFYSLLSMLSLL